MVWRVSNLIGASDKLAGERPPPWPGMAWPGEMGGSTKQWQAQPSLQALASATRCCQVRAPRQEPKPVAKHAGPWHVCTLTYACHADLWRAHGTDVRSGHGGEHQGAGRSATEHVCMYARGKEKGPCHARRSKQTWGRASGSGIQPASQQAGNSGGMHASGLRRRQATPPYANKRCNVQAETCAKRQSRREEQAHAGALEGMDETGMQRGVGWGAQPRVRVRVRAWSAGQAGWVMHVMWQCSSIQAYISASSLACQLAGLPCVCALACKHVRVKPRRVQGRAGPRSAQRRGILSLMPKRSVPPVWTSCHCKDSRAR